VSKGQQWPLAVKIGIDNGRKTRKPNQKLIKIMRASTATGDRRQTRVKARQKWERVRERDGEWDNEREKKNKPNNNIYDYFYEVLTNFYEFLMGPLAFVCVCRSFWLIVIVYCIRRVKKRTRVCVRER